MLIEFSATNFRSIGERQVLSLVPDPKETDYAENKLFIGRSTALNAIAIYGANGSGKSNLIKAIKTLDDLVSHSGKFNSTDNLPYQPFLLREGFDKRPTVFEVAFAIEESRYRYLVEYNATEILGEWLFRKTVGREVNLFGRQKDTIEPTSSLKGSSHVIDAAIEATKDNSLFLTMCDMFNIKEAKKIMQWFRHLFVIDGLQTDHHKLSTAFLWQNDSLRPMLKEYIASMRLGVEKIELETSNLESTESALPTAEITPESAWANLTGKNPPTFKTFHQMYRADNAQPSGEIIKLNWEDHESAGAQKILQLSGPVVWTLAVGGVLVIDEIEAKSHPLLTLALIDKFLSKTTNPRGAQLIFATHDTNILTDAPIRIDQIYFTEKNAWESTVLYSLADIESPLKGAEGVKFIKKEKEKKYLNGKFGAIPFLSNP